MSSFVCNAEHFNSIELAVEKLIKNTDFHTYDLKQFNLYRYDIATETIKDTVNKLILSLRLLNVTCVGLQYKENCSEKDFNLFREEQIKEVIKPTKLLVLTPLGLLNALNCLDYQIELEHLTDIRVLTEEEQKAILFLTTFRNILALHICQNLPEDKTNKWSI